jgi:hypothetical protein
MATRRVVTTLSRSSGFPACGAVFKSNESGRPSTARRMRMGRLDSFEVETIAEQAVSIRENRCAGLRHGASSLMATRRVVTTLSRRSGFPACGAVFKSNESGRPSTARRMRMGRLDSFELETIAEQAVSIHENRCAGLRHGASSLMATRRVLMTLSRSSGFPACGAVFKSNESSRPSTARRMRMGPPVYLEADI